MHRHPPTPPSPWCDLLRSRYVQGCRRGDVVCGVEQVAHVSLTSSMSSRMRRITLQLPDAARRAAFWHCALPALPPASGDPSAPAPDIGRSAMALHFELFCGLGANLRKSKFATDQVAWELSRAFWTSPKFEGPNGWQTDATRHYPPPGGWAPYFPTARDVCRHQGDVEAGAFVAPASVTMRARLVDAHTCDAHRG